MEILHLLVKINCHLSIICKICPRLKTRNARNVIRRSESGVQKHEETTEHILIRVQRFYSRTSSSSDSRNANLKDYHIQKCGLLKNVFEVVLVRSVLPKTVTILLVLILNNISNKVVNTKYFVDLTKPQLVL